MAKKSNATSAKSIRKSNATFHAAMTVFLAGCAAELYLLIINRYLVDGTLDQVLATAACLPYVIYGGLAALVVGVVLLALWWKQGGLKKKIAAWVAAVGAFVAGATYICLHFMEEGAQALCVAVPVVMLLAVVFLLYQKEFFVSGGCLSVTLVLLYRCRRSLSPTMIAAVCALLALIAAVTVVVWLAQKNGGKLKGVRLFPKDADYLPMYVSVVLSAASLVLTLVAASTAYYAMWLLGVVLFALAVYYTVKQL